MPRRPPPLPPANDTGRSPPVTRARRRPRARLASCIGAWALVAAFAGGALSATALFGVLGRQTEVRPPMPSVIHLFKRKP